MSEAAQSLEFLAQFERDALELLDCLGAQAPDSPRVRELYARCADAAQHLPELVQALRRAVPDVRREGELALQRIVRANAVAQDALRGEMAGLSALLEKTHALRGKLADVDPGVDLGESCDLRG